MAALAEDSLQAPAPAAGYIRALDGAPLYCVHHAAAPILNPHRRYFPVVIVPPLFEERKSAYATLRRLAERLALNGHAAMRFDFRGGGESGGAAGLRRWRHLSEDVAVVRKTLARLSGARDSVLLGLRMGGTLALLETLRVGGEAVLALAPVVSGSAQARLWKMRSKIRAELTQENAGGEAARPGSKDDGVFDFDGYEIGRAFLDDLSQVDLLKAVHALSCPGRILQLSHRTEFSAETIALQKVLGARAKSVCLRVEPFWDKVDDVDTRPLEDAVLQALHELG